MMKQALRHVSSPWARRWQRWAMGLLRLGLIAAAMGCLFLAQSKESVDLEGLLREAKKDFPELVVLGAVEQGFFPVLDASQQVLGWITTTNPEARAVQGYAGPSELLVLLDTQRQVKRVCYWRSADTAGHVELVRRDKVFWSQWDGRGEASLGSLGSPQLVSGASLTSEAMARGLAARFGAKGMAEFFTKELALEDVKPWFAEATSISPLAKSGYYEVSGQGKILGNVLRSSRMGVAARGFNGSSDVLVALDLDDRQVLGVGVIGSRDNEPYVSDVKEELKYADGFVGKSIDDITASKDGSDFLLVSGASTTAYAVIGTVQEMLRRHRVTDEKKAFPWQLPASMLWLAAGLYLGFRGGKKSRAVFAVVSVLAGLVFGLMVGQGQLIGWARHGVDWRPALPLLALTAVALLVPALTGKNVYCSRICPHGAAQTLAGMVIKKRFVVPAKLHRFFVAIPWLTLMAIWGLALAGSSLAFANAEPFEVWSTGFISLVPAVLFTISIAIAFFLPQGYCHYGCATGALLKFLTHAPGRWTKRDSVATVLVIGAGLFCLIIR